MERKRLPTCGIRYSRQNLNFLDKPLYLPLHKSKGITEYDDNNGFRATYGKLGPPNAWDGCILKLFVHKVQQSDCADIEIKSLAGLLKDLNLENARSLNNAQYKDSIWTALTRFKETTFYFEEFYDDKKRSKRMYSPIDFAEVKEDEGRYHLKVSLNVHFLEECVKSFSILQNLDTAMQLSRTPIASRLYEILCAKKYAMNRGGHWPIGLDNLFAKLGLKDVKYRSEKLRRLKKGMTEVQKVLNVTYTLSSDSKVLFYFQSDEKCS